jgi:hypothetical protein
MHNETGGPLQSNNIQLHSLEELLHYYISNYVSLLPYDQYHSSHNNAKLAQISSWNPHYITLEHNSFYDVIMLSTCVMLRLMSWMIDDVGIRVCWM